MLFLRDTFEQFNAFCRETTLHGFTYLADNNRTFERLLWLVFVSVAFASSIFMIDQSFKDAEMNPLLTTINTIDVTKVPFPAVTVLPGEYPVQRDIDGFSKRMYDYAEFERYDGNDALRNNSLFNNQWGFMTKGIVQKLIEATKKELEQLNDTDYKKLYYKYKNIIKKFENMAIDLAAISNKQNSKTIFTSLNDEIKLNFLKYKGFSSSTKELFSEVIEPFVSKAKIDANLTQQDIQFCFQGQCSILEREAQVSLMAPIEIMKLSDDIWLDIGAGHFLKSALETTGFSTSKLEQETTDIITSLLNFNFSGSLMEFPNYLSYVFSKKNINIMPENSIAVAYQRLGKVTSKKSSCNVERGKMYSYFWHGYLFQNGNITMRCKKGERNCSSSSMEMATCSRASAADCRKLVLTSSPCEDVERSKEFDYFPCCEFVKNFTDNLEATLKLMKFSVQAPHFYENIKEENEIFSGLAQVFSKSKSGFITKNFSTKTRRNFNAFVPLCQYAEDPETMSFSTCDLFRRSFTNMGLGYTFNSEKFWNMYKKTDYDILFERIMFPNTDTEILYPESSGPDYRLRLILDGDIDAVKEYEKTKDYTKAITEFTLGVHDPYFPANLRGESIKVRTGYETTIMITPKVLYTTTDAEEMSLAKRHCQKSSESNSLKIFKQYSREACVLECALDEASRRCGCKPWNYPLVLEGNKSMLLCDAFGNYCFSKEMKTLSSKSPCNCPNNCNAYTYAVTVSAAYLYPEIHCPNRAGLFQDFQGSKGLPKLFFARYKNMVENQSFSRTDQCESNLQYRAIVNIQIASQLVTNITMDVRVNTSDTFSNLGNLSL